MLISTAAAMVAFASMIAMRYHLTPEAREAARGNWYFVVGPAEQLDAIGRRYQLRFAWGLAICAVCAAIGFPILKATE